jgi:hypothetical protein
MFFNNTARVNIYVQVGPTKLLWDSYDVYNIIQGHLSMPNETFGIKRI